VCADITLPLTCRACLQNNRGLGAVIIAEDEVAAKLGSAIDHCHICGAIRDLLCKRCNELCVLYSPRFIGGGIRSNVSKEYAEDMENCPVCRVLRGSN